MASDITDADREAVLAAHPLSREAKEEMAAGRWDHHYLVQTLARHRIAARKEALEEAAKVADQRYAHCADNNLAVPAALAVFCAVGDAIRAIETP